LTGFSLIMTPSDFRNIAIIAHVDHGKTTLVDKLLRGGGAFRDNQVIEDRAMDSMDLEREKGITIKAKNTAVHWGEKTINIVDTPGHADFGGEVERVLKMVDGVLLLVDAYEGPMAQTRFVLRKAIHHGLKVVVVINKIDRENADPIKAHDEVLELLLELNAADEQFNAPFLYASARDGYAISELDDPREDLTPLFKTILEHIPPPVAEPDGPFQMLVSNIDWNDYVGRVAVGKIASGQVESGDTIFTVRPDGSRIRGKVTKLFEYSGLATSESTSGVAGNIVGISGFEEIDIGDTLAGKEDVAALPFVEIDPPTIEMEFAVNDGPLAGREGKYVTSRQLRDRLYREVRTNVSIKVSDLGTGRFTLSARGAMQIAVLVEQMRREGFEVLVSRPTVITKKIDGKTCEPFETLWVECPDESLGGVMQNLANRKARITAMDKHPHGTTVEAIIPTRGLIGFELDLVNTTGGRGVMSHLFHEYSPHCGPIATRLTGTLVSMDKGTTKAYGLDALESRGILFVGAGEEVYEGMIVGENPRKEDMPVNPTKAKQLTNFRSQGDGKGIQLSPPKRFTLERAIEYIAPDEYVEATPESIRLRKRILNATIRKRAAQTA
jgi:GTP-binding protein